MKVAVIGSRTLSLSDFKNKYLEDLLPAKTTEVVSGGDKGIDYCVRLWAIENGVKFTEFLPDYRRYGRGAAYQRDDKIIEYSDFVLAFWDGASRGTFSVIFKCKCRGVPVQVIMAEK